MNIDRRILYKFLRALQASLFGIESCKDQRSVGAVAGEIFPNCEQCCGPGRVVISAVVNLSVTRTKMIVISADDDVSVCSFRSDNASDNIHSVTFRAIPAAARAKHKWGKIRFTE